MSPEAESPKQESELSPQGIAQVFSMLRLDKEEERQKFCVMAEVQRSEDDGSRIWLSGTTASPEAEGGQNA